MPCLILQDLLRKNADSEPEKSQSPPARELQCLGGRITSTDQVFNYNFPK